MLFLNAKIITMDNADFENGYIHILDGKISSLGDMSDLQKNDPILSDSDIIDLNRLTVIPGLIDSHCHLGIIGDGLGFEGEDCNEEAEPITPHLRAVDAVNPFDRCFKEAVEGGVTTVLSGPGSANPIAGQWVAMKTAGKRIEDMLISDNIGMKFALGENPKVTYNQKGQTPVTRMAIAALIRENLFKAKRYMQDMADADSDDDIDEPEFDMKCEALIPVLQRKTKAFFHAHRADDIFTAIRIAKEFDLDYTLVHCTEGYKIADELVSEKPAVITGPIICDRSKPELKEQTAKNTAMLSALNPAICTDHPVIPIQYLALSAAVARKNGLSDIDALKAITINAAIAAGISDRVGSIKAGKDADLVVTNGNPLDLSSDIEKVIINGKLVYDKGLL